MIKGYAQLQKPAAAVGASRRVLGLRPTTPAPHSAACAGAWQPAAALTMAPFHVKLAPFGEHSNSRPSRRSITARASQADVPAESDGESPTAASVGDAAVGGGEPSPKPRRGRPPKAIAGVGASEEKPAKGKAAAAKPTKRKSAAAAATAQQQPAASGPAKRGRPPSSRKQDGAAAGATGSLSSEARHLKVPAAGLGRLVSALAEVAAALDRNTAASGELLALQRRRGRSEEVIIPAREQPARRRVAEVTAPTPAHEQKARRGRPPKRSERVAEMTAPAPAHEQKARRGRPLKRSQS